jgi:hypothetical protein
MEEYGYVHSIAIRHDGLNRYALSCLNAGTPLRGRGKHQGAGISIAFGDDQGPIQLRSSLVAARKRPLQQTINQGTLIVSELSSRLNWPHIIRS